MKAAASALILLSVSLIASCGVPKDKALLLKDWESVYVSVDPKTIVLMDEVLKEKRIGNVYSSESKIVFTTMESVFNDGEGPGVVVYSDLYSVPSGAIFIEMRVWQCYEAVLEENAVKGIHVNPGVSNKNPYTVSKSEIKNALSRLPMQERLPLDISIKE